MMMDVITIPKATKLVVDEELLRHPIKTPMDFFSVLYEMARLGGEYYEEYSETEFTLSRVDDK